MTIANAVSRIGPTAVPALLASAEDESMPQQSLADALAGIGPAATMPLLESLGHANASVRASAARALGRISPVPLHAADSLSALLSDADTGVRVAAATSLGQFGRSAKIQFGHLARAASDEDAEVRAAAVFALVAVMGSGPQLSPILSSIDKDQERTLPTFIALLRDEDWAVRKAACAALGEIGPPAKGAVPALQSLANDESSRFRSFLERTIGAISGIGKVDDR